MTDRHEPTISSLPIDRGEPSERAEGRTRPPNTGPQGARPMVAPASTRTVKVSSPLAPWALVLALGALGLSGFLFWQSLEAKTEMQNSLNMLTTTEQRVVELENKLSLADDESTQSMSVLQARVKENASEIRKLWGISYDRNRKAIEELQAGSSGLAKTVQNLEASVKKQTNDLSGEIRVVSELVDAQQAAIAKIDRSFTEQSRSIRDSLEKIDSLDSDLRQRMASNEEAIRSIDAFRAQVNREIMQLKNP